MTAGRRPSWRDAEGAAAALTPARRDLLGLLSRLPLAPVATLSRLRGTAGPAATYRHLDRLRAAGLADAVHAPLGPRRSHRLWYPTDLGVATLGLDRGTEPTALVRAQRLRRPDLLARLRRLPDLLALYRLLGALAAARPGVPSLVDWEVPWRRSHRRLDAAASSVARLPARVALTWGMAEESVTAVEYLLLPDLATAPLAARRDALDRLFPGRTALERAGERLPDLLVATDAARAGAWAALLEELRAARRDAPLPARIVTWEGLDAEVRAVVAHGRAGRPSRQAAQPAASPQPLVHPPDAPLPRLVGRGLQPADTPALRLCPQEWALLDLVARHPLLPRDLAAKALGWIDETLRRRRNALIDRGLVRLVTLVELGGGTDTATERQKLAMREPAEATGPGLRALAAWQGLSLIAAMHWNGFAGGGPGSPVGTRASLLAAPLHTLGVAELVAELAGRARRAARRDVDEGLVEWRNAAACARGWFRPDGYVAYRRGDGCHGAFLEYDRGSMGERDWSQKLGAYFAYRDGGHYRRDYASFPALLIVVAAERKRAAVRELVIEGTIAAALRKLAVGRSPLPALLTTATRLAGDPAGPLGPVWREADDGQRRHWLRPGRSPMPAGSASPPAEGRSVLHRLPPVTGRSPPRPSLDTAGRRQPRRRCSPLPGGTPMINRHLLALFDELRAEGIGDPLAQPFTLAALWDDLAALAGEPPPPFVRRALGGSRATPRRCAPDQAADPCPYRPPVDALLGLGAGAIADWDWPDYRLLGLGEADIPQLLRLALDPRPHLTGADDPALYAPVHACAALGQLGATAALPLLAELPRLFADEWLRQGLLALATGLGGSSIPALRALLVDDTAGWDVRAFAVAALVEVALGQPDARDAAATALARCVFEPQESPGPAAASRPEG